MKSFILDIDSIDQIVNELKLKLEKIENNGIVILRGDLASGKTTFVKNYMKLLGYDDLVTSPTFSLQSIYSNEIYHYDLYNKSLGDFIALGMIEEFEKDGIHFVEWGDEKLEALLKSYGYNVILLQIRKENDKRQYILDE